MSDNISIHCWNCNKRFFDVLKGSVQVIPSTTIKETKMQNELVLEELCPRCKKLNTIVKT